LKIIPLAIGYVYLFHYNKLHKYKISKEYK